MATLDVVERAVHVNEGGRFMTRRFVTLSVLAALAAAPAITAAIPTTVSAASVEKININTASVKELQRLDGVGRGVAQRIVDYREANGPFKRGEDLRKVEGVGAATFERNRERIVVK
jgi:competence ComEA-like helix-hairpin-helix protein